jgi:hypothetical protein
MFKKTIEYTDFNEEKKSKDFYFHLSKADLIAMAAEGDEFKKRVERLIAAKDGAGILRELRGLIALSVGVRSEDGQRFIKDESAQSNLLDSPAYDELLMELATNTDATVAFVQQLIPESMQKEMKAQLEKSQNVPDPFKETDKRTTAELEEGLPAYQKEMRKPTDKEVREMSKLEMLQMWAWVEQNNIK